MDPKAKDRQAPAGGVELTATPRDWKGPLLAEQKVSFDLKLKNLTAATAEVLAWDGNVWNPAARVYDAAGQLLYRVDAQEARERILGHSGEPTAPPTMLTLAPNAERSTWLSLAEYTGALPPGQYTFQATHRLQPRDPAVITSEKVPFVVQAAKVSQAALGYDSALHENSVLAWVAAAAGGVPQVLLRWSGVNHGSSPWGGNLVGPATAETRLALGQLPPEKDGNGLGWLAVVTGKKVELVRHNMSFPTWRSEAVELPLDGVTPVPRFPDRGSCAFLATGNTPRGPAIVGVVLKERGPTATWTVPLKALPMVTACAFQSAGPITLLLAGVDGRQTHLSRLDLDESGAIISAERVVRTTSREVLAVATDQRRRSPPAFLVLEAERDKPDHLSLVRLPVSGDPLVPEPAAQPGWPAVKEGDKLRVLRAAAVCLEVGLDGIAVAALVDEEGAFYGGRLGQQLESFPEVKASGVHHPHVATFRAGSNLAGFTDEGYLFQAGGHGGH